MPIQLINDAQAVSLWNGWVEFDACDHVQMPNDSIRQAFETKGNYEIASVN